MRLAAISLAAGLLCCGRLYAQAAETVQPLDDVEVIGKPQYLYESDRQLARLRDSLPGLETDRPAAETVRDRMARLLFADPNQLDPDQQAMLQRTSGETGPQNLP